MAITTVLAFQGKNRLTYRLTQDGLAGNTATITTTGAPTPDLLTDSLAGPIKKIARARQDGYGKVGPGGITAVGARALWLSAWFPPSSFGNEKTPMARCVLTPNSGATPGWVVTASEDGIGNPILQITSQAVAGVCFLNVEVPGAIGT